MKNFRQIVRKAAAPALAFAVAATGVTAIASKAQANNHRPRLTFGVVVPLVPVFPQAQVYRPPVQVIPNSSPNYYQPAQAQYSQCAPGQGFISNNPIGDFGPPGPDGSQQVGCMPDGAPIVQAPDGGMYEMTYDYGPISLLQVDQSGVVEQWPDGTLTQMYNDGSRGTLTRQGTAIYGYDYGNAFGFSFSLSIFNSNGHHGHNGNGRWHYHGDYHNYYREHSRDHGHDYDNYVRKPDHHGAPPKNRDGRPPQFHQHINNDGSQNGSNGQNSGQNNYQGNDQNKYRGKPDHNKPSFGNQNNGQNLQGNGSDNSNNWQGGNRKRKQQQQQQFVPPPNNENTRGQWQQQQQQWKPRNDNNKQWQQQQPQRNNPNNCKWKNGQMVCK